MIRSLFKAFSISYLALAVLVGSQGANAQLVGDTTGPGDSCASYPQGATTVVADSDADNAGVILICDGSVWQDSFSAAAFEYSSSGAYSIISNDLSGAVGFLSGGSFDSDSFVIGEGCGSNFIGHADDFGIYKGLIFTGSNSVFTGVSYDSCDIYNSGSATGTSVGEEDIWFYYYGTPFLKLNDGLEMILGNEANASGGQRLDFRKSRGGAPVQTGDGLGAVTWQGVWTTGDPFTTSTVHASIEAFVDTGTIDSTTPTKISFSTTPASGSMAEVMVLDSNGYLGIGDSTPDVELDVVGDINYTGVLQDVSDIRLKDDIRPLESPLKKLTHLNGFSFTMKDDPKNRVEYGVSAQDVQAVFPELVGVIDEESGHLGVSYNGLIAPMIEAIKEQQDMIEQQQHQIDWLKEQVAKMRNEDTPNKPEGL